MNEMGYGEQPFIVFKHTDIDRNHIHIVSVCVDEQGKKYQTNLKRCALWLYAGTLEKQHNLIVATGKEHRQSEKIFRPVDYKSSDIKTKLPVLSVICQNTTNFKQLVNIMPC